MIKGTDCYRSTNEQSHLNVICPQQNQLNYTVPELPRPVQQAVYYARKKNAMFSSLTFAFVLLFHVIWDTCALVS